MKPRHQDNIELFNRVVQAKEQKFVLAIDCLESLSADSDHAHVLEDFTWLPNNIPDTCRIIITCTTNSPQYQNFTENYNSKVRSKRKFTFELYYFSKKFKIFP